eukprot:5006031-Prymnesium_polylepis.2
MARRQCTKPAKSGRRRCSHVARRRAVCVADPPHRLWRGRRACGDAAARARTRLIQGPQPRAPASAALAAQELAARAYPAEHRRVHPADRPGRRDPRHTRPHRAVQGAHRSGAAPAVGAQDDRPRAPPVWAGRGAAARAALRVRAADVGGHAAARGDQVRTRAEPPARRQGRGRQAARAPRGGVATPGRAVHLPRSNAACLAGGRREWRRRERSATGAAARAGRR